MGVKHELADLRPILALAGFWNLLVDGLVVEQSLCTFFRLMALAVLNNIFSAKMAELMDCPIWTTDSLLEMIRMLPLFSVSSGKIGANGRVNVAQAIH